MTDITAFLAARLDEDEAAVHEAAAFYDDADENGVSWRGHEGENQNGSTHFWLVPHLGVIYDPASGRHIVRHDPARVLAEVKAKRAILARHSTGTGSLREFGGWYCEVCDDGCAEVPVLAAVYADHPDYDPAWRVE